MAPLPKRNIWRIIVATLLVHAAVTAVAGSLGVPFARHYSATEYKAHNRNYDVACDSYGSVFVANYDGILYYDGASWRRIQTPRKSRVTRVVKGPDGRIWTSGPNVFGYLEPDINGRLKLHTIPTDGRGGATMSPLQKAMARRTARATDTRLRLNATGATVITRVSKGVELIQDGHHLPLTKRDGLGSNSINAITYNGDNMIWGATEHGIFAIEAPSPFTRLTEAQGLNGEVYSFGMTGQTMYIGTMQGIYRMECGNAAPLLDSPAACWQMIQADNGGIIAATANGLYSITADSVSRMTGGNTLSVCQGPGNTLYTGETDGIYEVSTDSSRHVMIARIEKCVKVKVVGTMLRAETLYGEQWNVPLGHGGTLERINTGIASIRPKVELYDKAGHRWFTDPDGKNLQATIGGKADIRLSAWLRPMAGRTINAMFMDSSYSLWTGGDFGVVNYNLRQMEENRNAIARPELYIRQIVAFSDSVIWGGYRADGLPPITRTDNVRLPSDCRNLTIYFSNADNSLFMPARYRYRINDDRWSAWSEEPVVHFNNMSYGPTKMEIQSMNMFGIISNTASVEWYRQFPFYLKWWSVLIYVFLIIIAIRQIAVYRVHKLELAKQRLEQTVTERTEELSTARSDLERTQADLMRMERTATAGKLTQGLIDRILNPINYINNFSMLTSRLASDLQEDIRSEKGNMATETYDDCEEIISMMKTNLAKIEEHGANTTRTLRAMEAMLKNQIGTLRSVDMVELCQQTMEMAAKQYRDDIKACHIRLRKQLPSKGSMPRMVDPTSLRRAIMAVLSNAIYAVTRKYQRQPYDAEVTMSLASTDDGGARIVVHDNGIGIEEAIKDKIFDPFFTTKPTGEASGVGLYLARETIHDHNGTISMQTEKDSYTEFTITL